MIHELRQQSEATGLIPRNSSSVIFVYPEPYSQKGEKERETDLATSPQACFMVWILCVSSICGQLERKDSCMERWTGQRVSRCVPCVGSHVRSEPHPMNTMIIDHWSCWPLKSFYSQILYSENMSLHQYQLNWHYSVLSRDMWRRKCQEKDAVCTEKWRKSRSPLGTGPRGFLVSFLCVQQNFPHQPIVPGLEAEVPLVRGEQC